jgi:hypothetical protein
MMLLVSGAVSTVNGRDDCGHLIVPRQWNDPDSLELVSGRWAMDNGCFVGLDPGAFMRMLYAYRSKPGCLFVTAPDAVADAAETRYLWQFWAPVIRALGHRPAFVAQDGLAHAQVPWGEMGALFIGGSTDYKESAAARSLCGYAKAKGIWVHWGRVNGKARYKKARAAGADSFDGTGFSMAPLVNIPKPAEWRAELDSAPGDMFDALR